MESKFDVFWEQAEFRFVDIMPPLETCGNCGREIISVLEHMGEQLLLHQDKSMCWRMVPNV